MKRKNGALLLTVALGLVIGMLALLFPGTTLVDCMKFTGVEEPLDGKTFLFDATYEKSWELLNCGTSTWERYFLVRLSQVGQNTLTPHTVPVPPLSPGERGHVRMQVTTGTSSGHSRVYFMLAKSDESEHRFGDLLWLDHIVARLASD